MPSAQSGGSTVTGAQIVDASVGYADLSTGAIDLLDPKITSFLPQPFGLFKDSTSVGVSSNTTLFTYLFNLSNRMTVSKITIDVRSVAVAGTVKIAIYSEDGQTKRIEVTSGTISAGGQTSIAVSAVTLPAGNYWFAILPTSTANITLHSWASDVGSFTFSGLLSTVSSEPDLQGQLTVTASTIPSTITPTSVAYVGDIAVAFRLDN